jgi:hypothetical protein
VQEDLSLFYCQNRSKVHLPQQLVCICSKHSFPEAEVFNFEFFILIELFLSIAL